MRLIATAMLPAFKDLPVDKSAGAILVAEAHTAMATTKRNQVDLHPKRHDQCEQEQRRADKKVAEQK